MMVSPILARKYHLHERSTSKACFWGWLKWLSKTFHGGNEDFYHASKLCQPKD